MNTLGFTPRQIVEELNKYIIGQDKAKRAVAVALRNRYRRLQLDDDMKKDVTPKNLLMIGSTGVGKTEIARRMALLVNAPFIKVEATKFTEVGYVGRDVESMVRDLVDNAVQIVTKTKKEKVYDKANQEAIKRIAAALKPGIFKKKQNGDLGALSSMFKNMGINTTEEVEEVTPEISADRRVIEQQIKNGELDNKEVTIKILEREKEVYGSGPAMEQLSAMQNVLGSMTPRKKITRTVTVKEAKELFINEISDELVNKDDIHSEALKLAESQGIIFIDEFDKIAMSNQNQGGQVSREGVQRDILPIVEGSQVMTKYGPIQTEHILFIASGAFHVSKPTDLIPELQGRFPIRVELVDLTREDFERILKEPNNSLLKQYTALLATENIELIFTKEAIEKIAEIAYQLNEDTDNIGARRLHTILERLLEDLLFESPDMPGGTITITKAYVEDKVEIISNDKKLKHYIL